MASEEAVVGDRGRTLKGTPPLSNPSRVFVWDVGERFGGGSMLLRKLSTACRTDGGEAGVGGVDVTAEMLDEGSGVEVDA